MKGVLDARPRSAYDDDIATRYHFPTNYRPVMERLVGRWILYREPRREGGRQGYVAVAKVERVEPDPARADHGYAVVSNYTEFDDVVPLVTNGHYAESLLRNVPDKSKIGAALQGKSVREISDEDFHAIVVAGLGNEIALEIDGNPSDTFSQRRVEQVQRLCRDSRFRRQVCSAYESTCAVTGLKIPHGTTFEVQAAHILPVAEGGPDVVQNGIALSSTIHWLFDRHLIAISPDYRLLVARSVPQSLAMLMQHNDGALHLPLSAQSRPSERYLARHRSKFVG